MASQHDSDSEEIRRPPRQPARTGAKRLVQSLFAAMVLPRLGSYLIARRVLGERALTSTSESIARVPGLRGVYLRHALYRRVLERCGQDTYIGWCSVFSMREARVGQRAYIGRYCSIGFADIRDEVMLADGVQILSGGREHDSSDATNSMHEQGQCYRRVTVGHGAWIGAGAVIMADVGEHSIIGAGAVVTRPIPAHCVAVGVPAKVVKRRETPDQLRPAD